MAEWSKKETAFPKLENEFSFYALYFFQIDATPIDSVFS